MMLAQLFNLGSSNYPVVTDILQLGTPTKILRAYTKNNHIICQRDACAALAIPDVKIAAIFGVNEVKLQSLCEKYGGKPYGRFEDLLDNWPMDFIAIGSPSGLHAEQGIAAAKRGLPVLTEKPIDISTAAETN